MLDLVEQNDLIQQDGAKHDKLGALEAFDWHLTAPFKDVLEETIEWLDCFGAQAMKDLAHLDTRVGVRILATAGGDQQAIMEFAFAPEQRVVVVGVAQE